MIMVGLSSVCPDHSHATLIQTISPAQKPYPTPRFIHNHKLRPGHDIRKSTSRPHPASRLHPFDNPTIHPPPLPLNGILIQTFIPLNRTSDQKSPTAPERRQARLVLRTRIPIRRTQASAQRETETAHEVPGADPPAQDVWGGCVPVSLGFDGEEEAGWCQRLKEEGEKAGLPRKDESTPSDHLWDPVDAVQDRLVWDVVDDSW